MDMNEIGQVIQVVAPIMAIGMSWASLSAKVKAIEQSQKEVKEDIKIIKENHLTHLQASYEELRTDIALIKNTCEVKNCNIKKR